MADRTVTLTMDEIAELVTELTPKHSGRDFEPECPLCTAYRKLIAAECASTPDCPDCKGFGVVQTPDGPDNCQRCQGTGAPAAPKEAQEPGPHVVPTTFPMFANGVSRRKWESLQRDGYRMQRIHFARSVGGHEQRGTIDPWGKVLWHTASPQPQTGGGVPGTDIGIPTSTPGVAPSQAPSMAEVIAAALEALEDNDNHAATVILKTAQRAHGAEGTHAYHPLRHPNGYWCPNCVGPASAAGGLRYR